jgi:hypothetical protein
MTIFKNINLALEYDRESSNFKLQVGMTASSTHMI